MTAGGLQGHEFFLYNMYKLLFCTMLALSIACSVLSCEIQCENMSCEDPNCPPFLTAMKIGCNCCETCVMVIPTGGTCFNPLSPMPLPPPPFPEKCVDGDYCDQWTQTCQPSRVNY
ncbi:hypothetical protein AVEN_249688-1 [Araneus ventricosus]|uniref:IGFBP N-terminal domain-containing protein n=1 Tax=Araneus ventricosus TaxID=182803 RepID=A0A4Y2F7Z7_ARAVE|nr:hypothetical protein AVEN_249688-1 [Araneus ventricosus]